MASKRLFIDHIEGRKKSRLFLSRNLVINNDKAIVLRFSVSMIYRPQNLFSSDTFLQAI